MRASCPGAPPWLWLALWLSLGLVLRGLRVVARWDELSLAYAAYAEPTAAALSHGELLRAATTWIGLHPPLYGLIQGVCELFLPVPLVWLSISALLSFAAVALVGRAGGVVAAAVLATSAVQLADAAELNNYPLASFTLALVLALAGGPWWALALGAVLATWTHVLAAAGAAGVVLWRLLRPGKRADKLRLAAACVLGAAPVVVGGLHRAAESGTFEQPAGELLAWLRLVADAVGVEGLVLAPLVLAFLLWRGGAAAAAWFPVSGVLVLALLAGAAAPHQRPYLGLLAPAAAVALGLGTRRIAGRGPRRILVALVLGLCALRGGRALWSEWQVATQIGQDQHRTRALDVALERSVPGDTVWVVVPALQPDDDKTATGPLMWRFSPWEAMPIAKPVSFEYTDYRFGQPRSYRGRTVHTSTELDAQVFDDVAAAALKRGELWVVLADYAPAAGLRERVLRVLRPYQVSVDEVGDDQGLGRDLLAHVSGLVGTTP